MPDSGRLTSHAVSKTAFAFSGWACMPTGLGLARYSYKVEICFGGWGVTKIPSDAGEALCIRLTSDIAACKV